MANLIMYTCKIKEALYIPSLRQTSLDGFIPGHMIGIIKLG